MNVLLLTTSFPISEGSSSGIFVERLSQRLGLRCNLCVLAPAGNNPTRIQDNVNYRLVTFRYAPKKWQILAHGGGGIPASLAAHPWKLILLPFFLTAMLTNCIWLARKADVIYANWSICGVIAGVAGLLTGRPVITTIRGEDANRANSALSYRLIINLCLRLNRRVVTVSNDIAISLSTSFSAMASKIVMIPNGVDLPSQSCGKKSEFYGLRLIMIGSLIPRKSVAIALHALTLLPKNFSLIVVGDGPERNYLNLLMKDLGLQERVSFKGFVDPAEVTFLLLNSDVLVMTSKSEGRPNAVLEALAAGVPVVGSDIPGLRELIIPDVNGLLFPYGDYKALATSLLPLINRNLRVRLGEGGRRLIVERGMTWEHAANRYLHEFRTICRKGIS